MDVRVSLFSLNITTIQTDFNHWFAQQIGHYVALRSTSTTYCEYVWEAGIKSVNYLLKKG